jgi:hypothetical protein
MLPQLTHAKADVLKQIRHGTSNFGDEFDRTMQRFSRRTQRTIIEGSFNSGKGSPEERC